MVKKYVKKPVTVEAIIWDGNNEAEVMSFVGAHCFVINKITMSGTEKNLIINTLEGEHIASIGDYIVKGIKGEFYPVKPDIMEMTYDAVYDQN